MPPRYKDYWGYEINMMEELVKRLDFTYDIVNPPDGAWGMINRTGQWSGLTGMSSRGDADSGASTGIEVIGIIGDFLPNFARFQVCDVTALLFIRTYFLEIVFKLLFQCPLHRSFRLLYFTTGTFLRLLALSLLSSPGSSH